MVERELSVFVDESGDEGENSRYYIISLILHDQSLFIVDEVRHYEEILDARGLAHIPFHFSPLINGHKDYAALSIAARKVYLYAFDLLAAHLPFSYHAIAYKKSEVGASLEDRLRRDLVNFLFDHLGYFQQFGRVKIYYDDGQKSVTRALRGAFDYALATDASVYRNAEEE